MEKPSGKSGKAQVTILADIDNGTYQELNRLTLSAWLDAGRKHYLGDVKPQYSETTHKDFSRP